MNKYAQFGAWIAKIAAAPLRTGSDPLDQPPGPVPLQPARTAPPLSSVETPNYVNPYLPAGTNNTNFLPYTAVRNPGISVHSAPRTAGLAAQATSPTWVRHPTGQMYPDIWGSDTSAKRQVSRSYQRMFNWQDQQRGRPMRPNGPVDGRDDRFSPEDHEWINGLRNSLIPTRDLGRAK